SSVLFFGVTGTNATSYQNGGPAAPWVVNNEYALQVWAYNANDFLAVKQGLLQPWQVQPYDVWNFTLPGYTPQGGQQSAIGGVTFDPSTGRLYVSLLNADRVGSTGYLPLIEVFQVNVPSVPPTSAPPQVGTLAATPDLSQITLTTTGP